MLNAASWFVDRNVDEGRGASPAFHCEGRDAHVRGRAGAGGPHRERAARPRHPAGRPRAAPLPRRAGVRGRVLGRDQDRRGARSREHLPQAGGMALLPGRQRRPRRRRLRAAGRGGRRHASRGPRRPSRARGGRIARAASVLRGALRGGEGAASWPRRPRATIPPSGSTPPGRRERPRRPSISSTTWSCAARPSRATSLGIRSTDVVFSAAKLFFAYGLGAAGYFPAAWARSASCTRSA